MSVKVEGSSFDFAHYPDYTITRKDLKIPTRLNRTSCALRAESMKLAYKRDDAFVYPSVCPFILSPKLLNGFLLFGICMKAPTLKLAGGS
jgi:hypothetical protein